MPVADISSHLARHARILRWAALAAAALCVLSTAAAVLPLGGWGNGLVWATIESRGIPPHWAAVSAVALAALTCAALIELARMLDHVGRGALFSSAASRHFRRFALWFLIAALLRSFLPAALSLANSVAQDLTSATLNFDVTDMLMLLMAAIFYLVANLFDAAARLEDDSRSIV